MTTSQQINRMNGRYFILCLMIAFSCHFKISVVSFNIPIWTATVSRTAAKPAVTNQLSNVVNKVAVAGATGKTGRLVVQELLDRGVKDVVAIVRDSKKASEIFPDVIPNLSIVLCDLSNPIEIDGIIKGCDAAIWCATGFSDTPTTDPFEKLKQFFGLGQETTKQSIDIIGLPSIATSLVKNNQMDSKTNKSKNAIYPKLVMCSSAGVTRPFWDKKKKEKYEGAADIPIVRLNPFNILERKLESEMELRDSGVSYCIVRPCGLNDNWPSGSRPLFSQGDVAVGRNNRADVAKILVDVLTIPEATGKTFEMVSIAGYPSGTDAVRSSILRLKTDVEISTLSDDASIESSIETSYSIMQQLLPGEIQNSAALAMGQTYEQLDAKQTGRLGVRGKENMANVGLKPSS